MEGVRCRHWKGIGVEAPSFDAMCVVVAPPLWPS